jgi:hypothetical protein
MANGIRELKKRLRMAARQVRWGVLATWLIATAISAGFWSQIVLLAGGPPRRDAGVGAPSGGDSPAPKNAQARDGTAADSGAPYSQ